MVGKFWSWCYRCISYYSARCHVIWSSALIDRGIVVCVSSYLVPVGKQKYFFRTRKYIFFRIGKYTLYMLVLGGKCVSSVLSVRLRGGGWERRSKDLGEIEHEWTRNSVKLHSISKDKVVVVEMLRTHAYDSCSATTPTSCIYRYSGIYRYSVLGFIVQSLQCFVC